MHFETSELTKEVAAAAREFAQQHIKPHVMTWDEMQPEILRMINSDKQANTVPKLILYVIIGFGILSTVKIKNIKNGMTVSYTLVSEEEADLKAGKISLASPFGKGLNGKAIGEIAEINAPAGVLQFEILDISY